MLTAGDEMGRSQQGNNNAYCQDNDISWVDWSLASSERDLLRFTEALAGLRRDHPVFRRRRFFRGRRDVDDQSSDIIWLTPSGEEMTQQDWQTGYAQSLAALLNGEAISEPDPRGGRVVDAKFLLLFNAHSEPIMFTLPGSSLASGWEIVIDTSTAEASDDEDGAALLPSSEVKVGSRSAAVLRSAD